MSNGSQHVVPNKRGGWVVRRAGSTRASRVFETRGDAVAYAKHLAQRGAGELYVHGRDGTIRERDSYGSDPYPPRR